MRLFSKEPVLQLPFVGPFAPVNAADYPDSIDGRAAAAITALATIANAADVGRPFGPGCGLQEVRGWMRSLVPNDAEIFQMARWAAETLIKAMRTSEIDFEDVDAVLGTDEAAAQRYGLSAAQSSVLVQAVEEANQVLIAIVHGNREGLQAWNSDVDFAAATLAYYQIAILRFRTMGKLWRDPTAQAGPRTVSREELGLAPSQ